MFLLAEKLIVCVNYLLKKTPCTKDYLSWRNISNALQVHWGGYGKSALL